MHPGNDRIDARDWPLLCLLGILWGGSFFFCGVALKELPPFTLVFLRVSIAALVLVALVPVYGISFPRGLSGWKPFVVVAFFNNVLPFSLTATGQTMIASGLASILNATTPLFTVVVMAAAREERLSARRLGGVAMGLIGVVILRGGFALDKNGQGLGVLLCLGGAFSYAIAALTARRCLSDSPPLATATFQLLASSVMLLMLAAMFERPWQLPVPSETTLFAVFGLAVLSTALGYVVFFQILRRSGPTNVMLVTLLIPVTTILLGSLVLGERLSLQEIVGALVIASALLLIDGRVLNLLRRPRRATPHTIS